LERDPVGFESLSLRGCIRVPFGRPLMELMQRAVPQGAALLRAVPARRSYARHREALSLVIARLCEAIQGVIPALVHACSGIMAWTASSQKPPRSDVRW